MDEIATGQGRPYRGHTLRSVCPLYGRRASADDGSRLATMKRLIPIAGAALLLAGCAAATPAIPEDDYIRFVSELPSYAEMPTATLADLGKGFCEVREVAESSGVTQVDAQLQYLKMATDEGIEAGDAGAFLAYATARYCPEFLDESLSSLLD